MRQVPVTERTPQHLLPRGVCHEAEYASSPCRHYRGRIWRALCGEGVAGAPVRVTLVDRRNFHLFQPLLYQVATGGLSAGDISYPLRSIFQHAPHFSVIMAEVTDIDVAQRTILLRDGRLRYDTLIVAPGSTHQYFGHDDWATYAPALKTLEDALEIRRRIFMAFEAAEREPDPEKRRALMTFVIIGGGPTGELAGTLGELAHGTLKDNFRAIDPAQAQILLLEGAERILATFPPDLSAQAAADLRRLGVTVRTRTLVTDVRDSAVTTRSGDSTETIQTSTILWTAGSNPPRWERRWPKAPTLHSIVPGVSRWPRTSPFQGIPIFS